MIQVTRSGKEAELKVTLSIPFYDCRVFSFNFNCASEVYAGLLADKIQQKLYEHQREVRRLAYEEGYKDGKGKRGKQTYFKSNF